MTAHPLLDELQRAGLRIGVRDGRLAIRPANRLTPALRERILRHKPDLLRVLQDQREGTTPPDGWHPTPGGLWARWQDGRLVALQSFHPATGDPCPYQPPPPDARAMATGRARLEALAAELGADPEALLTWFADDLEHLARLRWEQARTVVADALAAFLAPTPGEDRP